MPSLIVSVVMVFLIVIIALAIVLEFGKPIIDSATSSSEVRNAETTLKFLDSYIREVTREGNGSVRVYSFVAQKDFLVIPGENAVEFKTDVDTSLFEYHTRSQKDNTFYIAGADVNCEESDGNGDGVMDLVIENSLIKAVFNKTARASPYNSIDTTTALLQVTEKTRSTTITFENSSVQIDSNSTSAAGTGFSELMSTGKNKPFCTVHFFVNSTAVDYDLYYRLYAGADFLTVFVRNVV